MLKTLELQSERYSATGSISARGVRNQLGRPHLDRFAVLVREAIQNSWDAKASRREQITFGMHLRRFDSAELGILKKRVFAQRPPGWNIDVLTEHPWGLFLYDRGTNGLSGPTRADVHDESDESRDFVDFVRNVGVPPDRVGSGGTYGFGKAALYLASNVGAILFHTKTKDHGRPLERFMGAALLEPHIHRNARYTGRHWWGFEKKNVVEPAEDSVAASFTDALGFPGFSGNDLGTTICVLSPDFEDYRPEEVIELLRHAALSYCWPKLIDGTNGKPTIKFQIHFEGQPRPLPDVTKYQPLEAFAKAFQIAVSGDVENDPLSSYTEIEIKRPTVVSGDLGLVKAPTGARSIPACVEGHAPFGQICYHVALIRAPHFVVKYVQGPPLPFAAMEYAGAFLADEESEHVFSESEPPTHDDWSPDMLQQSSYKTIVRVTLRRINEAMNEFAGKGGTVDKPADQVPLGALADALGSIVAGQSGNGTFTLPEGPSGPKGKKGSATPRRPTIVVSGSMLDPVSHDDLNLHVDFIVKAPPGHETVDVEATAFVVVEGGAAEGDPPEGAIVPHIVTWRNKLGNEVASGATAKLNLAHGPWRVTAKVPHNAVSAVNIEVRG